MTARLCVLQVIPALDAGGAERTAVDVARAVVKAGGVALIATAGGRLAAEAEAAGARIVSGPFAAKNPLTLWRNAALLARAVREHGVGIVHARSRAPAWSALIAARRTGAKFVTTYHGIYNAKGPLKRWYNSVMARGDAVIANSRFTAAHVLKEHRLDPRKLHVIPRGIDIEAFTPENVSPARIDSVRKAWGLKPGKPVILLPGRLTRLKGHTVFIEALARLPHRDFEAVMAGDALERDAYVGELRAALDRLNLSQVVRIPGHCGDMPAALLAADVVVTPSTVPESFGRVAVEAQAMGRIVVASALGGQTETVSDGVTGYLFPSGQAKALADAIAKALHLASGPRGLMAGAARENVLKNRYTVDAMCASTLDIYSSVLKA